MLLFLAVPSLLFADVKEYTLRNGLTVLMAEDHKSPLAVFQIWYRVGPRDEVAGKTGISHLLEHMMFKGTEKYASKVLSRTVQRHGGTENAFTSKDYTTYFQILPSDKLELSLDFESDRMQNLLLGEEETVAERNVVMEERKLRYEDNPRNSLHEEVMAAAFKVHPYRRPVIGWMAEIANIQSDELRAHYEAYYAPDNAVIIITGDIIPGEVVSMIWDYFSDIEPGPPRKSLVTLEPPQRGEKRVYLKREAELPYVLAVFHVPNLTHMDGYALDVLDTLLSGKSGRLYKSLVYEKKLALSASSGYGGLHKDPHLFSLEGTASPGRDITELEQALYAEIESIKETPPSKFEMQKAKNRTEASFIMGQDSIFYQALLLGQFEMLGDWRLRDSYVDEIKKVTAEDVQRVARKYLHQDNRTTGILIPLRKEDAEVEEEE